VNGSHSSIHGPIGTDALENDRRIGEFGRRAADDPSVYTRYILGEQAITKHLRKTIGACRAAADMLETLGRPLGAAKLREIADEAFAVLDRTTGNP